MSALAKANTTRTARVLVVEDDPDARELMGLFLRRAGYEVEAAADGSAGFERLEREPWDLVIADVMMPGLDGIELCRRLRAKARDAGYTPLLIVSALGGPDDRARGYGAGADAWMTKPVYANELLARAAWAIELKARHDRLEVAAEQAREASDFQRKLTTAGRAPSGVAVRVEPRGRSGGDLVHVEPLNDSGSSWRLFLSDSCGHDLTAGVSAVAVRALLAAREDLREPGRCLERLDRALARILTPEHFVTGVLAIWEPERGALCYASAGHPAPLLCRPDAAGFETLPCGPGFPMGVTGQASYEAREHGLAPGDRLLFHSDGLAESAAPDGSRYELGRAARIVAAAPDAESAADAILADLAAFRGGAEPEDDLSLVVVFIP